MIASHITWSTEGRMPLFPDERARLLAVRALASAGKRELALFCLVDEHVHAVLYGDRVVVFRRARAISRSLRLLAAVPLEPARVRPIQGRSHMQSVFGYVLRQPAKHGLPVHPALWSGSCFPDLLGVRVIGGLTLCLRQLLPRASTRDLLRGVGLGSERMVPVGIERVASAGAHELVRVVSDAVGVLPPLVTQEPDVVQAKRAASVLAREAGLGLAPVAAAGGFSPRTARRLALEPVPEEIRRAVLGRFALEERVAIRANPQALS